MECAEKGALDTPERSAENENTALLLLGSANVGMTGLPKVKVGWGGRMGEADAVDVTAGAVVTVAVAGPRDWQHGAARGPCCAAVSPLRPVVNAPESDLCPHWEAAHGALVQTE